MMTRRDFVHRPHRLRFPMRSWGAALCLAALAGMSGCQQQPGGTTAASGKASDGGQKSAAGKNVTGKVTKNTSSALVTEDAEGRKSLDGIPYDVWLDDPLAVVADSAAVPTPTDAGPPATASPPTTETKPAPAVAAAGGEDWASYITIDHLQEETKKLRNHLKGLLQTQAAYNENFEVVKMDGAVMAALAAIATEAKEDVSWKSNAPYIREYGWELVDSAKGLGKPNYDKTNAAYENMQAVFSGSIPAGAAEPAASRPYPEVAPRFYLMRRMKLAYNALKLNINTEEKLKSSQDEALQEAMVLAALTKVVALKDYGSADEPEYQQFMTEILQSCQAAVTAVKDQEFGKFSDALNVIDKACLNCHSQYKE